MKSLRPRTRRSARLYAFSVGIHAVLGFLLYRVVIMPLPLSSLFERAKVDRVPAERISFITIPRSNAVVSTPGRAGGDGRPETSTPARRVVAPATVPPGVPTPVVGAPSESGSGEVVGAGGALRGIRPQFTDPRLWSEQGRVVAVPRTPVETLDSALMAKLGPVRDSMIIANGMRQPGDWTFSKDGKKYGLQKGAHTPAELVLGDLHIPIPLGLGAPRSLDSERDRVAAAMEREIREHSGRAMNQEEFRNAVRGIRQRKERERAAAEKEGGQIGGE